MKKRDTTGRIGGIRAIAELSEELSLCGTHVLNVRGCGAILNYSEEEIRLSMRSYILRIVGRGLFCASYLYGCVRVEGEICLLSIEGREKK